ncbi:glutamine--fructose-6-phosphate aminotransferase [isomerizing] [Jannaschia pagri]|uniref:Glutamine--fructose-6-phosphate aminotransferase [isomerizing] n=1 Tax=Jannaschia pagri TaxID=2829797 RepID=A0ABQ4NQP0_9RHOB|nr:MULTISPECIES: glutamine--fructose-6-phosphate transaminase (isomerizing) [unclassified Jannaschia]GIT92881.1 glutamine--fructose-6-phosphate aminotransferase [isomerizing] [Jannaschia sp. AI_61]GIT96716.1 glutamine--fructose-6-phosphate aminotransferase [isomerizing] [Jannaschia sp. AI_62]
MCGIIGILGNHQAAPMMVEALRRLEYRGYDSAGIATVQDGVLDRRRAVGKLVNLADLLVTDPLPGFAGIGHTRWATHGGVTHDNAHPHRAGRVAVVHNGIIENFQELRAELDGPWESQTDTETVVRLCERFMAEGLAPRDAAFATIDRLRGAYALCFLFEGEGDLLVCGRQGPPLAIGHGDGEMFVGSDAIALSGMTDRVTYLEDGDRAVVTRDGAQIYDAEGRQVGREVRRVTVEARQMEKAGHKHFMAKEIHEQPQTLADVIAAYTDGDRIVPPAAYDWAATDRVQMVACGTAQIACSVAKYWFESLARLPVDVDIASEYRYREGPVGADNTALFVSQSGETADTLAALRYAKGKARAILAVVNVAESTIARDSDVVFPIHAGVEVGVASTKAFVNQLAVLLSLAIHAGVQRGLIDATREAELVAGFRALPGLISSALAIEDRCEALASRLAEASDILFLGRGPMYPMAHEGALKLKEISYIHAEAYASGELKHGPIALVDKTLPVVVFAPMDAIFDKTISNMQEVMARDGQVLLVTDAQGAAQASDGVWEVLTMPRVDPIFAPIVYAVPAQLLAYHTAVQKGTDVDQPRNLAKSVTVE